MLTALLVALMQLQNDPVPAGFANFGQVREFLRAIPGTWLARLPGSPGLWAALVQAQGNVRLYQLAKDGSPDAAGSALLRSALEAVGCDRYEIVNDIYRPAGAVIRSGGRWYELSNQDGKALARRMPKPPDVVNYLWDLRVREARDVELTAARERLVESDEVRSFAGFVQATPTAALLRGSGFLLVHVRNSQRSPWRGGDVIFVYDVAAQRIDNARTEELARAFFREDWVFEPASMGHGYTIDQFGRAGNAVHVITHVLDRKPKNDHDEIDHITWDAAAGGGRARHLRCRAGFRRAAPARSRAGDLLRPQLASASDRQVTGQAGFSW
ncbi:MAG: hypothetical protein ACXWLM_10205 [Myxococcales bacterium]